MSIIVKVHNFVSTKCDDFTVFNKLKYYRNHSMFSDAEK